MIASMMSDEKLTDGLCTTCNNSPSCFHHARRGLALFCEMFDNYLSPSEQVSSTKASSGGVTSTMTRSAADVSRLTGLCMNCEMRDSCRMPKPEGGVWHCESYQ